MIIPEYLSNDDIIAVTAVSDGVTDELDKVRFNSGRKQLENIGYKVVFTENVFTADEKGRSSSGEQRGKQLNELVNNSDIKWIISAKGGNFLNEMLQYVDFDNLRKHPKWFQGYSDNTALVHAITTKCDTASIYGSNFGEYGMEKWHISVENNIRLLRGQNIKQESFKRFQNGFGERVTGLEGYECDEKVIWKLDNNSLERNGDKAEFTGRLIGGCLDVLLFLQGTKYDGTLEFIEKYRSDGIIWYLETFDINAENLMMFLWKLKETGWFKYTTGFVFGRPLFFKSDTNTSYDEAVMYALADFNVPVIFDADFGHRGPRMTLINGALATISYENGKGSISYN